MNSGFIIWTPNRRAEKRWASGKGKRGVKQGAVESSHILNPGFRIWSPTPLAEKWALGNGRRGLSRAPLRVPNPGSRV